jgi:hypothetical protein
MDAGEVANGAVAVNASFETKKSSLCNKPNVELTGAPLHS